MSDEDAEEILRADSEFYPYAPRKILNDKYHAVVALNISCQDITNDQTIQTELTNRGVVCWEPLQKTKPGQVKIITKKVILLNLYF